MRIVAEDSTITFSFNTSRFTTGAPFTLAGSPSMYARVNGNATEITAGFTLTADFDSKTGENNVILDLSASASYTAGAFVEIFIAAGTVDSVSVVGKKVYEFEIGNTGSQQQANTRVMLAVPAVASGSSGGLPVIGTGANNFKSDSSANVTAASVAGDVVGDVQGSVLGDVFPGVGSISANTIAAAAFTAAKFGSDYDDLIRSSVGMASANLDIQLADLPTVAEFNARTLVAADYVIVSDLGVVQTADHTAAIADIPTVAEFNARTLAAASYATAAAQATAQADLDIITGSNGVVLSDAAIDALWDEVMEGTTTARQALRLANSANGGNTDGAATTTMHLRDLANTKNRITATVDADGNRTVTARDLT